MMNLDLINPYKIIKYLEEENARLKAENETLKQKIEEVQKDESVD